MFKLRSRKFLAFVLLATLLSACMETGGIGSQEREQACTVQDEATFARASAELRSLAARTSFTKSQLAISRCGYIIVTRDSFRQRANLDSLYGKIGSPSWQLSVAARTKTVLGSGRTYQNSSLFEFSSRNGKKVTRGELENLNRTLRALASSSVGRSSASVNIDRELAGAASLEKATARIRGNIATVATGIAAVNVNSASNAAPISKPAAKNSGPQCRARKSQCYASCESLENTSNSINFGIGSTARSRCKKQCSAISC